MSKSLCRLSLLLAAFLIFTSNAIAVADETKPKKITFTTKSKEAQETVVQLIRMIESFQFNPQALPTAQKAVAADPNFAFAHYLLAVASGPPPQAKPHHDKALELVKNASDGERRYLEALALLRAQKPADAGDRQRVHAEVAAPPNRFDDLLGDSREGAALTR